jgi:hypothetical protein
MDPAHGYQPVPTIPEAGLALSAVARKLGVEYEILSLDNDDQDIRVTLRKDGEEATSTLCIYWIFLAHGTTIPLEHHARMTVRRAWDSLHSALFHRLTA